MPVRIAPLLLSLLIVLGVRLALEGVPARRALGAEPAKPLVVFCAMGDVPYSAAEDAALPQQIADLPRDAEFAIHVGDIKTGKAPCVEAEYVKVSNMLAKSAMPLFIIPGDNEFNDCGNPVEAWAFWEKYFSRFDQRWQHQFRVFRQLDREENFSFVKGNVLFIGLNIVGGRLHDPEEWKLRLAQDLEWTRQNVARFGDNVSSLVVFGHAHPIKAHDPYFHGFVELAEKFQKPVLYLHGDGHRWLHDYPFAAKNILRVQVDQGGIAPPVKITVTDDPKDPFVFDRRQPHAK